MTFQLAAVAPAAPALGPAIAGMGLLVAFIVALALQNVWRATFGPFLAWLANLGISASKFGIHFALHPFGFARTINRRVEESLDWAVVNSERGMVWAFSTAAAMLLNTAHTIEQLAHDAWQGIRGASHVTKVAVTRTIRETVVKPVEHTVKVTSAVSKATIHALTHRLDALAARVAHIAAAIPHALPHVVPRVGRLERTGINAANLPKWLRKHLGAILAGGVLAAALAKIGLGWLRCEKTKTFNKRVCASPPGWLDDFLLGTVALIGTNSFRTFVEEAQAGFDLGMEGLALFIRELNELDIPKG